MSQEPRNIEELEHALAAAASRIAQLEQERDEKYNPIRSSPASNRWNMLLLSLGCSVGGRESDEKTGLSNPQWRNARAETAEVALTQAQQERDALNRKLSAIRLLAKRSQEIGLCEVCADIEKEAEESTEYLLGKLETAQAQKSALMEAIEPFHAWSEAANGTKKPTENDFRAAARVYEQVEEKI